MCQYGLLTFFLFIHNYFLNLKINKGWEQHKLENVFTKYQKRINPTQQNLELWSLTIDQGLVAKTKRYDRSFLVRKNDIFNLVPKGYFVYNPMNITLGTIDVNKYHSIAVSGYYIVLKSNDQFNVAFLASLLHTSSMINKYKRFSTGSLLEKQRLQFPNFAKVKIISPRLSEQTKIGLLMNQVNNLIDLQQRKLKQLKQLKKAMLQQLLANQSFPKVRFNDFKDSWKDYRLGEVFDEFSVKSKKENEYKLLSSTTSGMESRSGRVSGHSNIGYKVIDNGDIVLSPQNLWLGNINLNNMGKGIVSPSYHTFKIVNANPIFVNFQLKTKKMLFEYKMVSVQGASVVRRNLDMDAFKKIVIKIPNEKEQIKIASLFSSISNIINNHQNKLTQLTTLKKYLLQKLFI